jgi:Las17-binding protein actin regulator
VAVQSTVISSRDSANLAFYGRQHTAQALLTGGAVPPPPAASALYQVSCRCAGPMQLHSGCTHILSVFTSIPILDVLESLPQID